MAAGILAAWDELEFALDLDAAGSFGGSYSVNNDWSISAILVAQCASTIVLGSHTFLEQLRIEITETDSTSQVDVVFNGSSLYSGAGTAASFVLSDFKAYALATSLWYVTWSGWALAIDGTPHSTGGSGNLTSTAFTPAHIPFLGMPVFVDGNGSAGVESGAPPAPANFTSTTSVSATISGGWRFKYAGDASWTSLPVTVPSGYTIPGTGPIGLDASGVVISTATYGDHLNITFDASSERSGAVRIACPGANTNGDGTNQGIARIGHVYLLPDLPKGYNIFEQADHCALLYRGGYPRMRCSLSRDWQNGAATGLDTTLGVTHAKKDEAFFVETTSEAPEITEVMGDTGSPILVAPVTIACGDRTDFTPAGAADPCGDLVFDPALAIDEEVEVIYFYDHDHSVDALGLKILGSTGLHVIGNYVNYWGSPHWSIGHPPIPWEVDGSPANPEDFWWLVRRGFSALGSETFNRNRSYHFLTDILEEGFFTTTLDSSFGGLRWRGLTRGILLEVEPDSSLVYDSTSDPLWSSPDSSATFTFGATVAVTPSAGTAKVRLDLSDWSEQHAGAPNLATDILLDWDVTNVSAVRAYLVGVDDRRVFIGEDADIKGLVVPLPRGKADKYAGSWAIENGNGVVADEGVDESGGDGISAATMADIERATAFQLLPGSSRAYLELEIDNSGAFDLDYPELSIDPVDAPRVVSEHGSAQSTVYPTETIATSIYGGADTGEEPVQVRGGNGFRFGNVAFRNRATGSWLSPFLTAGAGFKPNIPETLAFANVALRGLLYTANVTSDIAAMFDSVEGNAVADTDLDTHGTILPTQYQAVDTVRFVLACSRREVPPLACFPMRARNVTTFEDDGTPEQVAYVWNQEPCISVTAGPVGLQVWGPDGDDTNYSTVRTSIPGWTETQFNEQVNNSEPDGDQTDAFRIFYDGAEMAKARPWRGWMLVHGLPDTAASNVSVDASIGREHYRAFTSGGTAWFSSAGNALGWTDIDTGLAAEWVCVRVVKTGITRLILLWVEDAGAIKVYESTDNGDTWSMATTLSTGSDNSKPFASVTLSRLRYVYWIKGSGPYAVYVAIVDNAGNIVATEAATSGIGAVDDAGGGSTISSVPQTGGEERVVLEVIQSGAVVTYTSTDGRTFA